MNSIVKILKPLWMAMFFMAMLVTALVAVCFVVVFGAVFALIQAVFGILPGFGKVSSVATLAPAKN